MQDVVDHARAAGLSVTATVDPAIGTLDAARALTVLRTIQESLTNVIKHAGPGANVTVSVRWTRHPGWVEIEIHDQGATGPHAPTVPMTTQDSGHGLLGLSERLALLGGTIHAGGAGNGWRVTARFPAREPSEGADDDPSGPPVPDGDAAAPSSPNRSRA